MDAEKTLAINCISDALVTLRNRMGITQEEMAELLRISTRAYGNLERRISAPSASTLLLILYMMTSKEIELLLVKFRDALARADAENTIGRKILCKRISTKPKNRRVSWQIST